MAKGSKVVSIYPSDDEILDAHKGYEGKRELLILSMDTDAQITCSANTTDKAKILFLIEVFKLHLLDGEFD
jgi:hypothetical protein